MSDSITVPTETATLPGGGYLVNAPIDKIAVPENRLRELRDYAGLAASMEEIGLRQPITITEAGVLVSGRHRLEAAKSLGWKTIPAFVVEDDDLRNRLTEIDENLRRLDLTVYEQSKHAAERERVLAALGQRFRHGGDRRSSGHGDHLKTEDIAKASGMSERSWRRRQEIGGGLGEKTRAVLDQADVMEEKHRNLLNSTTQLNHLANIANKHGDERAALVAERVLTEDGASTFKIYDEEKRRQEKEERERKRAEHRASLQAVELPDRKYEVIYVDPPWRYDYSPTDGRRIENHYPTMDLEEIKALEVPAAEDCTLFMWATSPKLAEAFEVLEAWGFSYRTCMVWVKDKIGMGYYARQRHELLLIAKRGEPAVPEPSNRPDSVITGERLEHSAKPVKTYELLERMYPNESKVELFARQPREGWASWGNEAAVA